MTTAVPLTVTVSDGDHGSTVASNKALAAQWFHCISVRDLDRMCALTADTWTMEGGPPGLASGHAGIHELFDHIGPIQQTWALHEIIGEGDLVVVRATNTCVQDSFFGVPGAGITQVFTAMFMLRFTDGLVVHTWRNAADLQRLFQLGARILPPA